MSDAGCLAYTELLPFSWQPLDARRLEEQRSTLEGDALDVLRAIIAVDFAHADRGEGDAGTAPELLRLEAKLDLLSALVGEVLAERHPQPPRREVTLTAEDLSWRGDPCGAQHALILASVHLSARHPRPLRLPLHPVERSGEVTRARFADLPQRLAEELARVVFLLHRRSLAERRGR